MQQDPQKKKRKKELSTRIAEEMINEIMMAGIAFIIILMGVNWFNMKWAWYGIMQQVSTTSGFAATATGAEVTAMLNALGQSFPFKYIFGTFSFTLTLIIAIILTVVGFGAKLWTTRTKGKLIIDIGRNIYVPAIVGILCIVLLQILAAFHLNSYMSTRMGMMPTISAGLFAWNSYGQLFIVGASLLIVGSIVKLIAEKNRFGKWKVVGNTLFTGSLILIIYYFVIRIVSMEVIIDSSLGNLLSVFLVSNQFSNWTLAFCVYFFLFGWELKNYGLAVLRAERKALQIVHLQHQEKHMQDKYGARLVSHPKDYRRDQPAHPKELGGAGQTSGSSAHRYVQPEGHYRHQPGQHYSHQQTPQQQRRKEDIPEFGKKV
ncbi:TPA: hypothetical protein HA265_04270 [Candidatus Woesearchaeota archaeon]|nr:hypothetical protein [Candidatus Woesearchaeota archaeon]